MLSLYFCRFVSSQTGAWIHRDSGLVEKITLFHVYRSVFSGGVLHLVGKMNSIHSLVLVDMEGKEWKTIYLPGSSDGTFGLSQGVLVLCLYNSSSCQILLKTNVRATEIKLWYILNYDSK
jgi:hypothetical protein